MRQLPTLRALQVFDAVARHRGMARAAEALGLTHGAVSQQLRQLEDLLGVRLLHRSPRGAELTEVGRRYHAQVSADLLRLENHTLEAMSQRPDGQRLIVGAVPVLADRWLLPRLPRFIARHPGCSLHLQVFPTQLLLQEPPYDVGLQYDDAPWPGAASRPLMAERCIVVCTPDHAQRQALARGDFRQAPLLQLSSRLAAWDEWFDQAGIAWRPPRGTDGHRFDLFSMLVEAVLAGLGVGLVPDYAVARELQSGQLVQAHATRSHGHRGYSLFAAPQRAVTPLAQAFMAWLDEEAAA